MMDGIERIFDELKDSLCKELDLGGLYSRNPVAHKWKAPYRSLLLREAIFWRLYDLLSQSYELYRLDKILGARILLRSSIETLATLIYLNMKMSDVLSETNGFIEFSGLTERLLLGSKNQTTKFESINVLTIIGKSDNRYPGIKKLYEELSETAHPSFEGATSAYCQVVLEDDVVRFCNSWQKQYEHRHIDNIVYCIDIFFKEYNEVWSDLFEKLEEWIGKNHEQLQASLEDR